MTGLTTRCGLFRATACRRRSENTTPTRTPTHRFRNEHCNSASSSAASSTSARPSAMPVHAACYRDLKPGNVMLGKYGETLVVDWGLAKSATRKRSDVLKLNCRCPLSGEGVTPTMMYAALGTPAYMPPEQAAGKLDELGPASDVYSLGATLYHRPRGKRCSWPSLPGYGITAGRAARAHSTPPGTEETQPQRPQVAGSRQPESDGPQAARPLRHSAGTRRRHRTLSGR